MKFGDIELIPGPEQNLNSQTILSFGSTMLLNLRLRQLGLRSVDVGGDGDCFFSEQFLIIYMVIPIITYSLVKLEFNTLAITLNVLLKPILRILGMNIYINDMSMQGAWCDALFLQAVADCQNVAIHIIESHGNFAGEALLEPHYLAQNPPTTIYLGHLDELHYVSTAAMT